MPYRLIALSACVWLAACPLTGPGGAGGGDTKHQAETTMSQDRDSGGRTGPDPSTGAVPAELLGRIRADLAKREGVAAEDISVLRAEAVVFNDGSLGCPEPGMMYTQALVDGYRVILGLGGRSFDYRASDRGYFRLCTHAGRTPGRPGREQ